MKRNKEISEHLTWCYKYGDDRYPIELDGEVLAKTSTNWIITELAQIFPESIIIDELQKRFWYKRKEDRLKILHYMLDFNEETRQWAYKKLLQHWYDECMESVCQLWEKYKEKDCACLVMSHAPLEYIRTHANELGDTDYASLCLRLGNEADFSIEKRRLQPSEYMYIATKLKIDISKEECELYLYQTIADCLNEANPDEDCEFVTMSFECISPNSGIKIDMIRNYLLKNKSKRHIYWDYLAFNERIEKEAYHRLHKDRPFQKVKPVEITQYFIKVAREYFPVKYLWMMQENEYPSIEKCPF